jgi:hypothetical protein
MPEVWINQAPHLQEDSNVLSLIKSYYLVSLAKSYHLSTNT